MLRAAVASAHSYVGAMRALGLSGQGGVFWTIKHRIRELGIDVSHFASERRAEDNARLTAIVAKARTYAMVLEELGIPITAASHHALRRRVAKLGIDANHLAIPGRRGTRRARWSDDELRAAVVGARSIAEVLRRLGLIAAGGNYDQVKRRIQELAIDTAHMDGRPQARRPARTGDLASCLVVGRTIGSHKLKLRLMRAGLKPRACERCGWAERAHDGRVPLELDHINGDRTDNRLENLRVLCPNCHALQPTHRGLNQRRRRSRS